MVVPTRRLVYHPGDGVENLEGYAEGGYHPIVIGDEFQDGRYRVVHKLGFGSYSTIWLARDAQLDRYVALKVLVASKSSKSAEAENLGLLSDGPLHPGQRFIPRLLDEFSFKGPNGQHKCLVQEMVGPNITASKEDSANFMFPVEAARSIAAQLIMGLACLHSRGLCHGDLHLRNILLCSSDIDKLDPDELHEKYPVDDDPIVRYDGAPASPRAPPHAIYPLSIEMPADEVVDPLIRICDYGTSFIAATERSPKLYTPPLWLPPEDFFHEPITLAADIWTLGISLYEILGERILFECPGHDRDNIFAEMVSTLGPPPARWWDKWKGRSVFFKQDGTWLDKINKPYSPGFRLLSERLWEMGRGETPDTCEWDVEGGEMQALEKLFKAMLTFEPAGRATAEELMESEYMVKWAMPAWERQLGRAEAAGSGSST